MFSGFMGSPLFQLDLLTAHEPEMRKCLEINERIFRFMERVSVKPFSPRSFQSFKALNSERGFMGASFPQLTSPFFAGIHGDRASACTNVACRESR